MLRLDVFVDCWNTTEKCGTASAILLVRQPSLKTRSKPAWAVPWEDQVSYMWRSGRTSHVWDFAPRFLSLPAPAHSPPLSLPLTTPHKPCCSCSSVEMENTEKGAPRGARLVFLSPAAGGHGFSSRCQRRKALHRLSCLETPPSAPREQKVGKLSQPGSCHCCSHSPVTGCPLWSPGLLPPELRGPSSPWHGMSPASAPAAFNGTGRNLLWVLLTWSPKRLTSKAREWSRASFWGWWAIITAIFRVLLPGQKASSLYACHPTGQRAQRYKHADLAFVSSLLAHDFCQEIAVKVSVQLWACFVLPFRKIWGERRAGGLRLPSTLLGHWSWVSTGTGQTKEGRRNQAGEINEETVLPCLFP